MSLLTFLFRTLSVSWTNVDKVEAATTPDFSRWVIVSRVRITKYKKHFQYGKIPLQVMCNSLKCFLQAVTDSSYLFNTNHNTIFQYPVTLSIQMMSQCDKCLQQHVRKKRKKTGWEADVLSFQNPLPSAQPLAAELCQSSIMGHIHFWHLLMDLYEEKMIFKQLSCFGNTVQVLLTTLSRKI